MLTTTPAEGGAGASGTCHIGAAPAPLLIAYADDDGHIGFASSVPPRCFELARGPAQELRERMHECGRKRGDDEPLFVPGMPEADHVFLARISARCWVDFFARAERGAVVWNRHIEV